MTEMDWRVGCFRCSKPLIDRGPFHCTSWTRPIRGQRWTTFALARVDVQPNSSAGIGLQIRPVPVAHLHKLCHTLWTIVQILNFPAVCQPYIILADEKAIAWLGMQSIR